METRAVVHTHTHTHTPWLWKHVPMATISTYKQLETESYTSHLTTRSYNTRLSQWFTSKHSQGRVHTCTCPCECSTVNNRFKGAVYPNLKKNEMLLVYLIETNSLDSICPGLKVKASMFVLKDWKELKGNTSLQEILSLLQSFQQKAAPRKLFFPCCKSHKWNLMLL